MSYLIVMNNIWTQELAHLVGRGKGKGLSLKGHFSVDNNLSKLYFIVQKQCYGTEVC